MPASEKATPLTGVPGTGLCPTWGGTSDQALAAVLKREREARGESQETLAYKAGLSSSSLGAIELGRSSPSWPTVRAIIAAWGMSLAELAAAIENE
jgi:DNA-binding XRE family transcriptional regulator